MALSSFEFNMQTMAYAVDDKLKKEDGVLKLTEDGLKQLMKEQVPHFEKNEMYPGVFKIRIPVLSAGTKLRRVIRSLTSLKERKQKIRNLEPESPVNSKMKNVSANTGNQLLAPSFQEDDIIDIIFELAIMSYEDVVFGPRTTIQIAIGNV